MDALDHTEAHSVLLSLIQLRNRELNTLAEAWFANGATYFGIVIDDEVLFAVPDMPVVKQECLSTVLKLGRRTRGQLYVGLDDSPADRARLKADAILLGQLLPLEQELEEMTQELIVHQDQILALYDLNRSLRNYLDLSESLLAIASESRRLTNSETAFVLLEGNDEITIRHDGHFLFPTSFLNSLLNDVQAKRSHVLINDSPGTTEDTFLSLLCLPIEVDGDIKGGLVFVKSVKFVSPDIKLAKSLADHAGAHIENVLLHQEAVEQTKLQTEVELAQNVQARLLPVTPPKIGGIDLYGRSEAASEVGGDFFDFIATPEYPFLFIVGDVAGHGLSAAMVMTMTRTAIRSVANIVGIQTPKNIIHRVNQDLYDDFTEIGLFTTAFIGQYIPESDEVVFANSGHSPVVYCTVNEKARILEADGTALGVLPASFCETQTLAMPEGAVLVVMTDGFPEAENMDGEMYGYERLLRLIEETAHLSAEGIAEQLFDSVKTFQSGYRQNDDQTVIVLKRVPQ